MATEPVTTCLTCDRYIPTPRYSVSVLLPHKTRDIVLEGYVCEGCAPKAMKHVSRHFGTRNFSPAGR